MPEGSPTDPNRIIQPLVLDYLVADLQEHKNELPPETLALLRMVKAVRNNVGKALPEVLDQSLEVKNRLMAALTSYVLQSLSDSVAKSRLPTNLAKKVEAILEHRVAINNMQPTRRVGRPRGSRNTQPSQADQSRQSTNPEHLEYCISSILAVLETWFPSNTPLKTVRDLPANIKAELLFAPFVKYATEHSLNAEDAMDDKSIRYAMAYALFQVTDLELGQAQSFYAHAARKFREKGNLYRIFKQS